MTYIAGWKYKGNIYLTSDSAITRDVKRESPSYSSVGEQQISTDKESINEESYKIFQIENDCIIAISGDVNNALEFVKNIRLYSNSSDRDSLLDKFCYSSRNSGFDAIIGIIVNQKPKLYLYRSNETNYLEEKQDFVCRGSGVSTLAIKTQELINSISKIKLYPTERLAFFVSGHQLFSINEDVFKKGVGGIFNGARISKYGIQWNEDISYVFFSEKTEINEKTKEIDGDSIYVFSFNRELMLYVRSPLPIPKGTDVLIPNCELSNLKSSSSEIKKWNKKYYNLLNDLMYKKKEKTKYISFINKSSKGKYTVSIVKMNNKTLKKIWVEYDGKGWYSLYAKYDDIKYLITNETTENTVCKIIKK